MPIEHLQTLREKYPQYADIPDQQLASQVIAKYPEYRDILGDVADLGVASRRNSESPSESPIKSGQTPGESPKTPGLFGFLHDVKGRMKQQSPIVGPVMASMVPETPTQVGILGASLAAGPFTAGMRAVPAILSRVGAASAGGAAGGATEGNATGGAMQGAIGGALGEALGLAKNAYGLWGPGKAKQFAEGRAAQLGQGIEEATKGALPGLRTSQDLYEAGTKKFGEYRNALYEFMKAKSQAAENAIGNRTMNVPAVPGGQVQPGTYAPIMNPGGPVVGPPIPASTMPTGGATLQEVNSALKQPGYSGYGGAKGVPSGRGFPGTEDRLDYGATMRQTSGELNRMDPTRTASKDWLEGRQVNSVGKAFLDTLKRVGFGKGSEGEKLLNLNRLKDIYDKQVAPRLVESVRNGRMTQAEYDSVEKAIYSGAPFGSRDTLSGAYSNLDALRALLRGEGGSPRFISSQIRTVLPGAGNKYVGDLPGYQPVSAGSQTGLNTLTEILTGKAMERQ